MPDIRSRATGAAAAFAFLCAMLVSAFAGAPAQAQQQPPSSLPPGFATGGAVPGGAIGSTSDSETWRQVRHGAVGRISIPDKQAATLVQAEGETFRLFRAGPLARWGAWGLFGILFLLAVFYVLRGRIAIEAGFSTRTVLRFSTLERFTHWLTAGPFVVLGLSGLNMLYGKHVLLPLIGPVAFAEITWWGKWAHNYLGFAFTVGVILMIVLWVRHNLPTLTDLRWLLVGGGLFTKGVHPPARKFNAGQKFIFWVVVLLGLSLATTGFCLMFPFQFAPFEGTFKALAALGIEGLPSSLTPLQETQLALLWHSIVALIAIVVIIAHIYIGSLGMEGAIGAVTTGEVDANWAHEHHSLWYEETQAGEKPPAAPAE